MKKLVALIAMQMVLTASGQPVNNANTFLVQPTITRDGEGFTSCGIRIVAGALGQAATSEMYDFGLSVWEDGSVLFKAGSHTVPFDLKKGWDVKKLKPKRPAPNSFWMAKRDDETTLKPLRISPSDDPGFSIGIVDTAAGIGMLRAILDDQAIQLSLSYGPGHLERIVALQPKMADEDKLTVEACFSGLRTRMKSAPPPR